MAVRACEIRESAGSMTRNSGIQIPRHTLTNQPAGAPIQTRVGLRPILITVINKDERGREASPPLTRSEESRELAGSHEGGRNAQQRGCAVCAGEAGRGTIKRPSEGRRATATPTPTTRGAARGKWEEEENVNGFIALANPAQQLSGTDSPGFGLA